MTRTYELASFGKSMLNHVGFNRTGYGGYWLACSSRVEIAAFVVGLCVIIVDSKVEIFVYARARGTMALLIHGAESREPARARFEACRVGLALR